MKLTVLGSSSSGNCYVIQNDDEAIIIEAGVNPVDIKKALNFNLHKVKAMLVTHNHGDHAGYADKCDSIFPIFTINHVIENRKLKRATEIAPLQKYKAGGFTIMPFAANHDIPCVGYIISHSEFGNLFFLTDSFMCGYKFNGLNHILIESNYSDKELNEAIEKGITHASMKKRLMTTHMEIGNCCRYLNSLDLSNVYNVMLLHLSSNNSDSEGMLNQVKMSIGIPAIIAKTGVEIELSNEPF